MTRIDFYTDAPDKLEVACRVVNKAYRSKCRVLVWSSQESVLARLDKILWTTPAVGFVPHCFASEAIASETPVLLARASDAPPCDDVLINLDDELPPHFSRFQRLAEIVSTEETDKIKARIRYKFYRDRGYEIATHRLTEATNE